MRAHGQDRLRFAGGRAILVSPFSKGWTARVPKKGTHAEYPGTAVMWDGNCFEVVAVEPSSAGIRYVLSPWREDQTIRLLDHYDAEAEDRRLAAQREKIREDTERTAVTLSSPFAGLLPATVQNRLGNRLSVSPARMTILSCGPLFALFAAYAFVSAGALIAEKPSPFPPWVAICAWYLLIESGVRFYIAMSQQRGVGSAAGTLAYGAWWLVVLKGDRTEAPWITEKGWGVRASPPPSAQELLDDLETRGPLISLLPPSEQLALAERYGFDYRRHAYGLTWTILLFSGAGVVTSAAKLAGGFSLSAAVSLFVAAYLAGEQVRRLILLREGPAGSVMAAFVRPFLRRVLLHATSE